MKFIAATLLPLSLLACATQARQAQAQTEEAQPQHGQGSKPMEISRGEARPTAPGPARFFTGAVTIKPLFDAKGASQVGAALVTFQPGARTAWHRHPLGQRLVIIEGNGRTQIEGGPLEDIRAGDVVWCPPNVRHWHGAAPDAAMAHIAIQESANGSPVTWMEPVTDEQYRGDPGQ